MKKEKYNIEFVLGNASQKSLWRMLTDSTAMEEWFADSVKIKDETFYTFIWDDNAIEAEMVLKKPIDQVRYNWLSAERANSYFEFKIHKLDLTREIALEVIDFADSDDMEDAIFLWENQIDLLKRKLGI
jgi:uncharacterized protein YndB with AHSA1/START domain